MNDAYLIIGGNLGAVKTNLAAACEAIETHCGPIFSQSALYKTAAWGKTSQPDFLNQALHIKTALTPQELLKKVLTIEKSLGRIREEKYGPRIIDIDILFYNDSIIETNTLTVPHPHIQNRRFVLKPLQEIAPYFVHPVLQKSISQLLKICPDKLAVRKTR